MIKKLRKEYNLSIIDLANESHIKLHLLLLYEFGIKSLSVFDLVKLCNYFDQPADVFLF